MILESAAVGPFFKNGYVVGCERTRQAIYIDPGDEVEQMLAFIADQQLQVTHILLTHAHVDHVSGVAEAKRALGAPIYLHKDDQFIYDNAVRTGMMFGLTVEQPPPVDHYYEADTQIVFGDYEVRIVHTPGHCPGGVCLVLSKKGEQGTPHLFVGDTLFAGSIGRTDLPGGDYDTLLKAITEVLFTFPDDAIVYSGHGPETTIGEERASNPFVLEYLGSRRV
jgi:hydroxyacylglutathione hydrolase